MIKQNMIKYGKLLADIGFDLGPAPRILVRQDMKVYATRIGADLAALTEDDITDIIASNDSYKAALIQDRMNDVMIVSQTEYTGMCIEENLTLPAVLDDMAQIVGTRVPIVNNDRFAIAKALRKVSAVMTTDGHLITCGRNLYEARNGLMVLEKNAEIFIDADFLGGAKPVGRLPGKLEHIVYLRKYSQAEMAKQNETEAELTFDAEQEEINETLREVEDEVIAPLSEVNRYSERELEVRRLLVEYGNKLVDSGLVVGTWGNLSIRLDDTHMICSPSGRDYRELTIDDYVRVDMETLEYEGDLKPTSEKSFHAGIYRNRPDVAAVIHTHSKYACVFAACDLSFDTSKGEHIDCAKYALSGTKMLSRYVQEAVGDNPGCLMSHHGMVAVGSDIETAFHNARSIENAARDYINKFWEED